MKMLKSEEIRKMPAEERKQKLKELKIELMKSRVGSKTGKTKDIKRAIARLLTFVNADNKRQRNK